MLLYIQKAAEAVNELKSELAVKENDLQRANKVIYTNTHIFLIRMISDICLLFTQYMTVYVPGLDFFNFLCPLNVNF